MLIEFRFSNYRSFKEQAILSMEATGIGAYKDCLLSYKSNAVIPAAAIYGKNAGGKSNVIRAFWFSVQFIRNAQRTQHENAPIPVQPFLLDDESKDKPTSFDFVYVHNGVKYYYGFSATRSEIVSEYLYHTPKGQKVRVFERNRQNFIFSKNNQRRKRMMISEAVASNQLYFAVACTMNESACMDAMSWFREYIFFSRDYSDIPRQLVENAENPNILESIKKFAKTADLGIEDMDFSINSKNINNPFDFSDKMPSEIRMAVVRFLKLLSDVSDNSEVSLKTSEVHATSLHSGIDKQGNSKMYELSLADESDGTRRLMALAPAIQRTLDCGGILLVDELEKEMHPLMVEMVVSKFQNSESNSNHAQLVFTTHDTELLDMELLRKDQLYFADKDNRTGESCLYSVSELGTPTNENIRKGYMLGKYGAIPDISIEDVN